MKRYQVFFEGIGHAIEICYAPNEQEARLQSEQRAKKYECRVLNIVSVKYLEPRLPSGRCKHINREYDMYKKVFPNRDITFREYLFSNSIKGVYDAKN